MAINVNQAMSQAGNLSRSRAELEAAKRKLVSYRDQINSNWKGKEVPYFLRAIDQTIVSINHSIAELDSLKRDIVNTANQIRAQELEDERRQREEQRRREEERRIEQERIRQEKEKR